MNIERKELEAINDVLDNECIMCWSNNSTIIEKIRGIDKFLRRHISDEKTLKDKEIEELKKEISTLRMALCVDKKDEIEQIIGKPPTGLKWMTEEEISKLLGEGTITIVDDNITPEEPGKVIICELTTEKYSDAEETNANHAINNGICETFFLGVNKFDDTKLKHPENVVPIPKGFLDGN